MAHDAKRHVRESVDDNLEKPELQVRWCFEDNYRLIFSSPEQSSGRAIALPPASVSALAKC